MDAYTQSYVKIPVLASILVNSRLYLKLTYTAKNASAAQIRSEISAYAYDRNSMQLPDYSPLEVNDSLVVHRRYWKGGFRFVHLVLKCLYYLLLSANHLYLTYAVSIILLFYT